VTKLHQLTGWQAKRSLAEILEDVIAEFRAEAVGEPAATRLGNTSLEI
jgi:hypothetical protein